MVKKPHYSLLMYIHNNNHILLQTYGKPLDMFQCHPKYTNASKIMSMCTGCKCIKKFYKANKQNTSQLYFVQSQLQK